MIIHLKNIISVLNLHKIFQESNENSYLERWKKLIYSSKKGGALIFLINAGHYIHRDDPKSVIGNTKILSVLTKNMIK